MAAAASVFEKAPWLESARGDLGFIVSVPHTIRELAPQQRCCWQRSARAARRAAAAARAAFVAHVARDAAWPSLAAVRGVGGVRVARLRVCNFRAFRFLRELLLHGHGEGPRAMRLPAETEQPLAPDCYESYICPFSDAFLTALSATGCVHAAAARVTAPEAARAAHAVDGCSADGAAACGLRIHRKWFRSVRLRPSNKRRRGANRGNGWSHLAVRRTTPDGAVLKAMPVILLELSYQEPHRVSRDEGTARSSLVPVLAWGGRLARLQATAAHAVSLNAYISTLGGGYFLCAQGGAGPTARAHMTNAHRMAIRQLEVAQLVGDAGVASQCRLHLVYIAIQCGRFAEAARALRREWRLIRGLNNAVLLEMVRAARLYLKRTKEMLANLGDAAAVPTGRLDDNAFRQRILH